MERTPDRIGRGGREREPGGTLASLATAMLAVHGFDRHGNPLRPAWADKRKARTGTHRPVTHKRSILPPPVASQPPPRAINPYARIAKPEPAHDPAFRTVTRNLNVTD